MEARIPAVSQSFEWTAQHVAKLGGNKGVVYTVWMTKNWRYIVIVIWCQGQWVLNFAACNSKQDLLCK